MAAPRQTTAAGQDQPERRQGPAWADPVAAAVRACAVRVDAWASAPGFRGLDLSDDQKAQLKKIADARRSDFEAAGQKVRAAREGMQALLEARCDERVRDSRQEREVAAAEADVMILNAKVRQESLQVLTAEQQAKLKEQREKRQGDTKQRRPRGPR